jgi:hypothetical protein
MRQRHGFMKHTLTEMSDLCYKVFECEWSWVVGVAPVGNVQHNVLNGDAGSKPRTLLTMPPCHGTARAADHQISHIAARLRSL